MMQKRLPPSWFLLEDATEEVANGQNYTKV